MLERSTNLAKKLRQNQTKTEEKLWVNLRAKRFAGFKFKRQQPLGNYIVDFICFEANLIIEVDGGQHNEEPCRSKDDLRTKQLTAEGYRVLRFWNSDISENMEGVLLKVKESLENL